MSVLLYTLQRTKSENLLYEIPNFPIHPQNTMCYMGCNIQTETEDVEGLRHASAL